VAWLHLWLEYSICDPGNNNFYGFTTSGVVFCCWGFLIIFFLNSFFLSLGITEFVKLVVIPIKLPCAILQLPS